jgi:hypothetical protein
LDVFSQARIGEKKKGKEQARESSLGKGIGEA